MEALQRELGILEDGAAPSPVAEPAAPLVNTEEERGEIEGEIEPKPEAEAAETLQLLKGLGLFVL